MHRRILIALPLVALFTFVAPARALITGGTTEEMNLMATGTVKVSVADASGVPITSKYIVEIREKGVDPNKGGPPGSWGGSAQIGGDGSYTFKGVPAGKYMISGKPNPGRTSDRTKSVEIEVKGFDSQQVGLTAK